MRALLDVNVLIALLDENHITHDRAWQWMDSNIASGWATCPIRQPAYLPQPAHRYGNCRATPAGNRSGISPVLAAWDEHSRNGHCQLEPIDQPTTTDRHLSAGAGGAQQRQVCDLRHQDKDN